MASARLPGRAKPRKRGAAYEVRPDYLSPADKAALRLALRGGPATSARSNICGEIRARAAAFGQSPQHVVALYASGSRRQRQRLRGGVQQGLIPRDWLPSDYKP